MSHPVGHRRHKPAAAVTSAPVTGVSPRDARKVALGKAAVVTWYLGGFLLLAIAALVQVGPFAWMAAWQVRSRGTDDLVLAFLPGFALLVAPLVVLRLLPRQPGRPFLCGAQDALRATAAPPATPDRMAHILLRCAQTGFTLAALCLVAGGTGAAVVLQTGARDAGRPLPNLTLEAATGMPVPHYARLVGVVPRPDRAWLHDHTVRQTRYLDVYTPLTGPGWRSGDAVSLLAEERTVAGDAAPQDDPARRGSIEGRLERGALPAWMLAEMRRSGIAITDDPVVLVRSVLGGVTPGPDMVDVVLCAVLGAVFAVFLSGISLAWLYKRRKLLHLADGPPR